MKNTYHLVLASLIVLFSACSKESVPSKIAGTAKKDQASAQFTASNQSATSVVAIVNGEKITEMEIAPLIQNGMDRSIALNRRITQAVVAQETQKRYSKDTESVISSIKNDLFMQIYSKNRAAEISKQITDAEIKTFYDTKVSADDLRELKLKILLTQDAREAQTSYQLLTASKDTPEAKALIAKMQYLKKDGEHFAKVLEVPYNLGQLLKKMKVGDVLLPPPVREGILLVYIEELKEVPKPELAKLKDEIRNFLVVEKLENEIQTLRKNAQIELKG